MLSRHPMEPVTHHDRTLAELVAERNGVIDQTSQLLNLSEEGHVFDHEPGYTDYHHDRDHHRHEYDRHVEFYETARYPHNLESSAASTNDLLHHEREQYYGRDQAHHLQEPYHNDTESNLYRAYPVYSPLVPHDW